MATRIHMTSVVLMMSTAYVSKVSATAHIRSVICRSVQILTMIF